MPQILPRPATRRRRHTVAALVVMVLLAGACGQSASETAQSASVDDTTTDGTTTPVDETTGSDPEPETASSPDQSDWPLAFSGDTVSGASFDAGDYQGQDLVLWFWAPW